MLREARRRKEEQELEGSPYKETWATRTLLTRTRAPQNVDVLAVLDFQMPGFRPKTPALYSRSLLTNHESHGGNIGYP